MNHCVPNWDLENGTFSSSDTVSITKGYWDSLQPKRSMPLENDLEELLWEKGPVVNKVGKRLKVWENEDAVLPGKPSPGGKDNTLDSVAHEIASSSGNSLHEDEVAQFLYYPLDDSFEREYCSDFFEGMQPNMYMLRDSMGASSATINDRSTHINTQKELFMTGEGSSPQWTNLSTNMTIGATNFASQGRMSKEAMTPKALDRGATPGTGRSVVSQNGSDFFPRIRTATQSPLSKWQTGLHASNSKDIQSPCKKGLGQVSATPSTMLPPKPQAIDVAPLKSDKSKLVNFSHFSRPAVSIKANLQSIGSAGASSTSGIISKLDKLRAEGNSPTEPSIIESNNTNWTAVGSSSCANSKVQGTYQNNQNMLTRKTSDATATCSEDFTDSTTKVSDQVTCQNSEFGRRSLASGATEKCGELGDGPEATVTSSSGGSGNSGCRTGKEAQNSCKRKGRSAEDSECQSEDVEFESMERKKPVPPRTTSKRSRAAEVHNLSERRRRDRINEKMRALQELIPHCNKSDKASMLDEAIEYLKTLQLQVQLMSMGGGMGMAPMVIPGSMQHFQVPQMAHLSHLGMGIGMGMGYSMGMLEMGGSSGRPLMPLPQMHVSALPGSALHCQAAMSMSGMPGSNAPMTRCPGPGMQLSGHPISNMAMSGLAGAPQPSMVPVPTSMTSDMQERMQNTGVADPYKHYTNSHHMHLSPQVINGNLYNNSMPQQTLMQQPVQASSQSNGKATQNAETGTGNSGTPG